MAFFGLQWVPGREESFRASEASPEELANMSQAIRLAGRDACAARYAQLYTGYIEEYTAYDEKRAQAQSWKEYIDARLPAFTAKEAVEVQSAALAWRTMNSDFYTYYDRLSEAGRAFVQEYYQFLEAMQSQETAEATLWNINAYLEIVRQVEQLWDFEAESAALHEAKLREAHKEHAKRHSDVVKACAAQAARARRTTRRYIYYRPPLPEVTKGYRRGNLALGSSHGGKRSIVTDREVESVLVGLDRIAVLPPTPPLVATRAEAEEPEDGRNADKSTDHMSGRRRRLSHRNRSEKREAEPERQVATLLEQLLKPKAAAASPNNFV